MQDYQSLNRHLEAVEANIPTAGLVEESEERLVDRISLYQVLCVVTPLKRSEHVDILSRLAALFDRRRPFIQHLSSTSVCVKGPERETDRAPAQVAPGSG